MTQLRGHILETLRDFDHFGGASIELTAWELQRQPRELEPVWDRLIHDNLIRYTTADPMHGEDLYRLTTAGQHAVR